MLSLPWKGTTGIFIQHWFVDGISNYDDHDSTIITLLLEQNVYALNKDAYVLFYH
jgi:hypothetical protein